MVNTSDYFRIINQNIANSSGIVLDNKSFFDVELQPMSVFKSDTDIVLPYTIKGRLISAKTYPDEKFGRITIAPESLKESVPKWIGIEIYTSHEVYRKIMRGEDVSINEIVGKIINASWNDDSLGVDFTAEIYDRAIAYKMDMGLIKFISAGFGRKPVVINGEYYLTNLVPVESSLVKDPRDKDAEFSAA